MPTDSYAGLKVLVVDDFNNFRVTLKKIMMDSGFRHVDGVSTGEEALSHCKKEHYDLILCDYNLGQGKNGQQLLEELRIKELILPQDIFILLSAETSRNVVMSAYDCEPDAYLTKPITAKVIQQRLKRLLGKRKEMAKIYQALSAKNYAKVIALLEIMIDGNSRYSMDCQKMLSELYIEHEEWDKAEAVFRTVLDMRELDWAQVGLAQVKIAKGEPDKAAQWLSDILQINPSCMKAYDALSIALEHLDETDALQKNLEKAVEMSPMSIGRQVALAQTALENGDAEIAVSAYRKAIKHGVNSFHDTLENQLNFAKAVSRCHDTNATKASEMAKDALKVLSVLDEKYEMDTERVTISQLLDSQLRAIQGEKKKSQEILDSVTASLDADDITIDIDIEIVEAMIVNGNHQQAEDKLKEMVRRYSDNQKALEKIDPLLAEPVSLLGKKTLATANKKGIQAYKDAEYESAIDFFIKLEKRFPRYIGVKLNLAQAIIGQMRNNGIDEEGLKRCSTIFDIVKRYMSNESPQFSRYKQLQNMLQTLKLEQ